MQKHPIDDLEEEVVPLGELMGAEWVARHKRPKRARFAKLEAEWSERLYKARTLTVWPIASYILFERFSRRANWRPIRISNAAARAVGIRTPRAKLRAIRELERLGLIRVKWASTRSPVILELYPFEL